MTTRFQSLLCLAASAFMAFAALHLRAADGDNPAELRAAALQSYRESVSRAAEIAFEQAQQMQVKAKKSGNVTASAVAKTAVRIATDAKAAAQGGELPKIPENVRRELQDWAGEFKGRLDAATTAYEDALKSIAEEFGEADDAPESAAESESADSPGTASEAQAEEPVPDIPPNASGAAANWLPVARVSIECDGMEMISLPVAGIAERTRTESKSDLTGQPYAIEWAPLNELVVTDRKPVLRAVPENGRAVDVTEWPSAGNGWRMEVRVRPDSKGRPLKFLLEAGEGTADLRAVASDEAGEGAPPGEGAGPAASASQSATPSDSAPSGAKVKVRFESDPEGAMVVIDGRPLSSGGRALLTPFDAAIPPSAIGELRFRKRGFNDAIYRDVTPKGGATLRGRLAADPKFTDKRVSVRASSSSWQASGIKVRKGQKVSLEANGKWQCGGEMSADALGYPNDDQCFAYYLDPRKYPRTLVAENFGCMLVKVAPDGAPHAIHSLHSTFVADADGTLSFEVNEAIPARRDNRGSITMRIQIAP